MKTDMLVLFNVTDYCTFDLVVHPQVLTVLSCPVHGIAVTDYETDQKCMTLKLFVYNELSKSKQHSCPRWNLSIVQLCEKAKMFSTLWNQNVNSDKSFVIAAQRPGTKNVRFVNSNLTTSDM